MHSRSWLAACLVAAAAACLAAAHEDAVRDAAAATRGTVSGRHCGGLFNQYAALVDMLALARALSLAVVVPPAMTRSSMQRGVGGPSPWYEVAFGELFDAAHLREALPELHVLDAGAATAAWLAAAHAPPVLPPKRSCLALGNFSALLDDAAVHETARARRAGVGARRVHLRLPCMPFVYAPASADERAYVARAEAALRFNATLRHAARGVVARLGGARTYAALHLRCEEDARVAWHVDCADPRVSQEPLADVDAAPPLYVATGEPALARYLDARFRVVTHGDLGVTAERYGGSLEHVAAVDALVLGAARQFVGFGMSSYSFFIARARAVAGAPSRLVRGYGESSYATFSCAFPGPPANASAVYLRRRP